MLFDSSSFSKQSYANVGFLKRKKQEDEKKSGLTLKKQILLGRSQVQPGKKFEPNGTRKYTIAPNFPTSVDQTGKPSLPDCASISESQHGLLVLFK